MKRLIVLTLAAAALAVPAAQAAPPKGPTMAQFNALKAQLAKDEKTIAQLTLGIGFAGIYGECLTSATADAFQGTWAVIDQIAQATQAGKTYFGAQTSIPDLATANCGAFQVTRSHLVPPNVSVFSALAALLA
jgi:hypothetical protein